MKKRLLILLLATMCVTACGNSISATEESTKSDIEAELDDLNSISESYGNLLGAKDSINKTFDVVKDVTVAQTIETEAEEIDADESIVEEITSGDITVEETKAEVIVAEEVVANDQRIENCLTKISRLTDAYVELIEHDHELDLAIQNDIENLTYDSFALEGYTFADGEEFGTSFCIYNTGVQYYYQYINENGNFYKMADWMSEQPDRDIVAEKYMDDDDTDTNNIMLMEAIAVAKFLSGCTNIEAVDLVETKEFVISDVTSEYAASLLCDGVSGLTAIFDQEGNLLNIRTPEDWVYETTFN